MHQLTYIYTDRLSDEAYRKDVAEYARQFPTLVSSMKPYYTSREEFDKRILDWIMGPYEEFEGNNRELVLMEHISINFVENKLMDVIEKFQAYRSDLQWENPTYPPIILIDGTTPYLGEDLQDFARYSDSFVVLYDTTKKEATANLLVNKQFWDWWVIGGRWPMEFKVPQQPKDVVTGFELSALVDKSELDTSQYRTSALYKDINWKERIQKYLGRFLELHDQIKEVTSHLPPAWKVLEDSFGKVAADQYYRFNTKAFDAWRKEVREVTANIRSREAKIEEAFFITEEDLVGLSRREVIRYAIARAYCPAIMLVALEGQKTDLYKLDFFCPSNPQNIRNIIRAARRLKPDTVVIAVDVHN